MAHLRYMTRFFSTGDPSDPAAFAADVDERRRACLDLAACLDESAITATALRFLHASTLRQNRPLVNAASRNPASGAAFDAAAGRHGAHQAARRRRRGGYEGAIRAEGTPGLRAGLAGRRHDEATVKASGSGSGDGAVEASWPVGLASFREEAEGRLECNSKRDPIQSNPFDPGVPGRARAERQHCDIVGLLLEL
jgi:hypothetical protein